MRAITQCGLSLSCLETIQEGNLSRSPDGKWCGRGDLNPHGQSPTDFLTSYGFRRHDAGPKAVGALFVVWTIPSPCRPERWFRRCPSSLYTFLPRERGRLGSGSPCQRVPRIWAVLRRAFPRAHSYWRFQVRCVYRFRHARTCPGEGQRRY